MIENLLSKLHKVKKTGSGKYLACCPAHDDKRPSMSIAQLTDGRVLLHCFAGCSTDEMLGSMGLKFPDLFPEKLADHMRPIKRPHNAADVLEALSTETLVVSQLLEKFSNEKELTGGDWIRIRTATRRINAARDIANGIR